MQKLSRQQRRSTARMMAKAYVSGPNGAGNSRAERRTFAALLTRRILREVPEQEMRAAVNVNEAEKSGLIIKPKIVLA